LKLDEHELLLVLMRCVTTREAVQDGREPGREMTEVRRVLAGYRIGGHD